MPKRQRVSCMQVLTQLNAIAEDDLGVKEIGECCHESYDIDQCTTSPDQVQSSDENA